MNLHNPSHAGIPRPEELVPSRYALRIGEIDVMVVSDGVLPLPTAMLAHNIDPAVRATWLKDMFLPPDAYDWALNVVVVRSGSQTILVDAGLGLDPELHLPRAGQLVKRLEAAGIDLGSVTDVVWSSPPTWSGRRYEPRPRSAPTRARPAAGEHLFQPGRPDGRVGVVGQHRARQR